MKEKFSCAFRPRPVTAGYSDGADLLRVLAVAMIAAYHFWQQSGVNAALAIGGLEVSFQNQVATGYMFVDVLLMLSGFLLYLPYTSGKESNLRTFYGRRAIRILPSYWFCIFIMLFAFALPQGLYTRKLTMAKDLLAHATFTHNLFKFSYFATPLNAALWTLAIEVQFYVLFPFIARAFRKQPGLVYAGMLLITMAYRYWLVLPKEDTTYYLNRLLNLLEVYANGMMAAHLYGLLAQRKHQPTWAAWLWTILAIALLCGMWQMMGDMGQITDYYAVRTAHMQTRFLFSAYGALFLVSASRAIALVRWLCSNRLVRWLSGISFNFYIWHQVLATKLREWHIPPYASEIPYATGEQPWQWQYLLLCIFGALALATAVTYLVERPAAKLGKRLLKLR